MSKTILLIDDDEVERAALRKILEAEPGWRLVEARDGQEGLDMLCDRLRPQLCVIDLTMPRLGGRELVERIRRDAELRPLKIVIASARRDRDTVIALAQLRIEGYLLKPFQPEKTLTALQAVMANIPDPDEEGRGGRDLFPKIALVVDDDPVARAALTTCIRRDILWKVKEVASAEDALARLREGLRPHLCFIDLNLPDLSGDNLVATLRGDPRLKELRIAIVSGEQDRDRIRQLANQRIDAYLLKPVQDAKVHATMRLVA